MSSAEHQTQPPPPPEDGSAEALSLRPDDSSLHRSGQVAALPVKDITVPAPEEYATSAAADKDETLQAPSMNSLSSLPRNSSKAAAATAPAAAAAAIDDRQAILADAHSGRDSGASRYAVAPGKEKDKRKTDDSGPWAFAQAAVTTGKAGGIVRQRFLVIFHLAGITGVRPMVGSQM